MTRRRYLLSVIASAFKWIANKFTYLYNSIIPATLNSKQVLSKARLSTIEGNSVVDNQLVNTNTSTITLTNGHKYLTYVNGTWSYVNGTNQTLSVSGGTDMVIDLTQMFPFDTPTTLTDNRVQALINRGTIPYNVGEIKNSVVSEITCTRLPKEYKEVEYIESTGTQYINTGVITNSQKIKAHFYRTANDSGSYFGTYKDGNVFRTLWYQNNNQIQLASSLYNSNIVDNDITVDIDLPTISINTYSTNTGISTLQNEYKIYIFGANINGTFGSPISVRLYYFKVYENNVLIRDFVPCYRVSDNEIGLYDLVNGVFYTNQGTGTFAKGNDVSEIGTLQLPAPLEIAGVNTAHNTFQITNNGYVFTRNVFERAYQSGDESLSNVLTDMTNTLYQLATPQVISIPKKHLGWVDLGTLTWTYLSAYKLWTANLPTAKSTDVSVKPKLFTNNYQTISYNSALFNINFGIGLSGTLLGVYKDVNDSGTIKPSGILFFETNAETTDFNKEMNIQGGKYLNSDSQVLPNVEMLLKCK